MDKIIYVVLFALIVGEYIYKRMKLKKSNER